METEEAPCRPPPHSLVLDCLPAEVFYLYSYTRHCPAWLPLRDLDVMLLVVIQCRVPAQVEGSLE